MTTALARRVGRRAAAAAVAGALAGGYMMLGAGIANAQTRQVVCTISPAQIPAPVTVTEGDQVQLVLDLGAVTVRVGDPQPVQQPGIQVLSAAYGLLGDLCRAAVDVQAVVTSAVPVPPLPTVPTLPPLLPSQSVQLPLPGADVSVETGGDPATGPGGGDPGTGQPPAGGNPGSGQPPATTPSTPNGSAPGYRFDSGRIPLYDFSSVPYGVSTRFGAAAAPAFRFGQRVAGYAPQFGILGAENDVAGKVQALPLGGRNAVGLPVLLAVLMLSTVAGVLVRTWVLPRA